MGARNAFVKQDMHSRCRDPYVACYQRVGRRTLTAYVIICQQIPHSRRIDLEYAVAQLVESLALQAERSRGRFPKGR